MNIIYIILTLVLAANAEKYAVLVAGSYNFYNYRHQSDVCHAYKTLIKNGYKADNIITFAYDDIANHKQNKFKGEIYNSPTIDGKGDNVYDGCVIDYTKNEVNPTMFLNVILGKRDILGVKKILRSDKDDQIFMYFSDHGAPGLIAFPKDYLYEQDLTKAFKYLAEQKKFSKLVFYLESCESGSMFINLPKDIGIYAVSAANPTESSWGVYCPPDDLVDGYSLGSCLGDEFSVNFLKDTDSGNSAKTLQEQFEAIRDSTEGSHVMQWGDLSFVEQSISDFLWDEIVVKKRKMCYADNQQPIEGAKWDSRDNKLMFYLNRYKNTQAIEDYEELQLEWESRKYFDNKFNKLASLMRLSGQHHISQNQECLKQSMNIFKQYCTEITDYGLKYVKYLAEMCDRQNSVQSQLNLSLQSICMSD